MTTDGHVPPGEARGAGDVRSPFWSRTLEASIPDLNVNARPAHVVRRFRRFLEAEPIRVVDVGGRGGLPGELAALAPHVDLVTFEPDAREAARLEEAYARAGLRSVRVSPTALGPARARTLHVTREPGRSSLLPPNAAVIARYGAPEAYDVVDRRPIVTVSAADALEAEGVPTIDFLKLDVQGFELAVLESLDAPRIESVLMVECEVEFVELYSGQPLFRDVDGWLVSRGFELFLLSRVFANYDGRRGGPYGRGQLLFGDAYYLRTRVEALDPRRLAKLIVLAAYYGFADYAAHLFRRHRDLLERLDAEEIAAFEGFLAPYARSRATLPAQAAVGLRLLLDRLLFALLTRRRWNGLKTDSDRCYPTR